MINCPACYRDSRIGEPRQRPERCGFALIPEKKLGPLSFP